MRNITVSSTVTLITEECCNCGVLFAMTDDFVSRMKAKDIWFYCPNGHRQHYCETTEQKLLRRIEQEKRARKRAEVSLEIERSAHDSTRNSLRSVRGHRTRILKRVHNGVCPHCNRHFNNLCEHMKTKHKNEVGP